MSPRSSIGCIKNDFQAYGTFDANLAPILHQDWHYIQMDQNELPLEHHQLGVPSGVSKIFYESMVHLMQTVHLSCSDTNNVSKRTEMRFNMTHVS
jgi:hypothetical protein